MSIDPASPFRRKSSGCSEDIEPGALRLDAHRDYVMARVMARGGWVAMQWLRRTYSAAELASFLGGKGAQLAPRERAYWAVIAGVDVVADPGGGRKTLAMWFGLSSISPTRRPSPSRRV